MFGKKKPVKYEVDVFRDGIYWDTAHLARKSDIKKFKDSLPIRAGMGRKHAAFKVRKVV